MGGRYGISEILLRAEFMLLLNTEAKAITDMLI